MTVSYNKYSKDFKIQSVKLANVIGVKEAANALYIPYATLYGWYRSDKAEKNSSNENDVKTKTVIETDMSAYISAISTIETELRRENKELKKQTALLESVNGSPIHLRNVHYKTEPTDPSSVMRIFFENKYGGKSMDDVTKILAEKYGITNKVSELENRILEIPHAAEVEFDISGFFDEICQVILLVKYDIPLSLEDYFDVRKKFIDDILAAAKKSGLKRSGDNIEDHGEHFYIVTEFINGREWIKTKPVHKRSR